MAKCNQLTSLSVTGLNYSIYCRRWFLISTCLSAPLVLLVLIADCLTVVGFCGLMESKGSLFIALFYLGCQSALPANYTTSAFPS